jgi:hypothetical protein
MKPCRAGHILQTASVASRVLITSRNKAIVITYSVAPTIAVDIH